MVDLVVAVEQLVKNMLTALVGESDSGKITFVRENLVYGLDEAPDDEVFLDLLILAEATSALDSAIERDVTETIRHRLHNRTILVVAHRLSSIRNTDQVLVFSDRRIVEQGR